jgi:hypothetical protein
LVSLSDKDQALKKAESIISSEAKRAAEERE